MKTKKLVEAFATLLSFVIVFALIGVLATSFSNNPNKDTDYIKSEQDVIQSTCTHIYGAWKVTKEPTCKDKGVETRICSLCNYEDTKEIETTEHDLTVTMYQAPTCTTTGTRQTKCNDCKQYFLEELPIQHNCGEATCTEPSVCTKCGLLIQSALGHTEATLEAVAPTCTEKGLTKGLYCSACEEILVAQEEISALGHIEVIIEGIAPTCDNDGLTEGKKCSVCNTILVKQETIDALPHTIVTVPSVPVTCTTDGYTEASYCSVCEEVFVKREVIKATGHKNDGIWHKNADGTFYQDCSKCGTVMKNADVVTFNITYNIENVTYIKGDGTTETGACATFRDAPTSIKSNATVSFDLSTVYTNTGGMSISVLATNCTYELTRTSATGYSLYICDVIGDVVITFTGSQP